MLEKMVIKDEKNDQVKKEERSIQSIKSGLRRKTSNFPQVLARKILVSTVVFVASWKFSLRSRSKHVASQKIMQISLNIR